jgi:PIN domain nuclease of toxin-antitoxin system
MSSAVVDTHTAVWYFGNSPELSATAASVFRDAAAAGNPVFLPSISLVELTYLVERGRVPPVAVERLKVSLDDPASVLRLAPLTRAVADAVAHVPRDVVPDMPDRIIAATALALGLPLVTRDAQIRASSVPTIW